MSNPELLEKRRAIAADARKQRETQSRLAREISKLSLEEIKEKIPRSIYEGILMASETCKRFLKSKDPELKEKGAKMLLDLMSEATFLKVINQLQTGVFEENRGRKVVVNWGNEEQKEQ